MCYRAGTGTNDLIPTMSTINKKFLYKLIVQFMRFVSGQNKVLDDYILPITKKLKQGVKIEDLQQDMQALSKALDHSLRMKQSSMQEGGATSNLFIQQLCVLLETIEIPDKFVAKSLTIRNQLIQNQNGEADNNLVQSAVTLILEINQYFLSEQKDTEKFLDNISSQLSLLDSMTQKATASSQASYDSHAQLNMLISTQIENIKNSAIRADDLNALQENITLHLQDLTTNLQRHQNHADSKLLDTQRQLAEMSKKIKDLEAESKILKETLKQAHNNAFLDPLTELPNRLAYNEKIEAEFKTSKRYQTPMSLLVWDVDYFKSINDTYGHKAGDKVLCIIAQLIKNNCRETDFVARYGGEEFVMILPNINAKQAWVVAEKIRKIIAEKRFSYNDQMLQVTISGGLTDYQKGDRHPDDLFERADKALYQAKEGGRNRCVIYGETA